MGNNVFKRFFSGIRGVKVTPNLASHLQLPEQVDFGVSVNTDSAMKFTAIFAAVKLISENIAALPKTIGRVKSDGTVEDAVSHRVYSLLKGSPNGYSDSFIFWFNMISSLELRGNAYALIERDEFGYPVALHQLRDGWVTVVFDKGRKYFRVETHSEDFRFLDGLHDDGDVIHLMFFTLDGLKGIDPIRYNAATIGRGIATQKFGADFYTRGGNLRGVMETDRSLSEAEWAKLQNQANTFRNGATPVLEAGLKYHAIGVDPVQAKLIESEILSIQDVARIFSVPPHLLAEMTHATFSNIEQQNTNFATITLRPICKRIEEQLEAKLLTSKERGRYSIKFDLNGLMRGDSAARSTYYSKAVNDGWMTPNEARRLEGFKSLPGLDYTRLPLNTARVDADGKVLSSVEENETAEESEQE